MVTLSTRGRRSLAAVLLLPLLALGPAAPDPAERGGAGGTDACGPVLTKADGRAWTCSFVDEFEGSTLDPEKWITQDTGLSGFRTGLTCYRGADNVAVRSGTLVLEARDAGTPLDCSNRFGPFTTRYTGGLVSTRGHFSQAYGRFEVRASFPTARTPGVHGGFWMFPPEPTYGRWPASGEIDVAEWWSNEPTLVLPSLHYPGRSFHADSGWRCRVADVSEFHVYTAEWAPTEIRFLIDGTECWTRTWEPLAPLVPPQPFDHPFSLILNMGVGTTAGTNPVSAATPLPATFRVDYVKAWR